VTAEAMATFKDGFGIEGVKDCPVNEAARPPPAVCMVNLPSFDTVEPSVAFGNILFRMVFSLLPVAAATATAPNDVLPAVSVPPEPLLEPA